MKGKLIHTEHRTSDISEYYFNNSSKLILKNRINCTHIKSPEEMISRVLLKAKRPIVKINFGPFSLSLLYAVVSQFLKIILILN